MDDALVAPSALDQAHQQPARWKTYGVSACTVCSYSVVGLVLLLVGAFLIGAAGKEHIKKLAWPALVLFIVGAWTLVEALFDYCTKKLVVDAHGFRVEEYSGTVAVAPWTDVELIAEKCPCRKFSVQEGGTRWRPGGGTHQARTSKVEPLPPDFDSTAYESALGSDEKIIHRCAIILKPQVCLPLPHDRQTRPDGGVLSLDDFCGWDDQEELVRELNSYRDEALTAAGAGANQFAGVIAGSMVPEKYCGKITCLLAGTVLWPCACCLPACPMDTRSRWSTSEAPVQPQFVQQPQPHFVQQPGLEAPPSNVS